MSQKHEEIIDALSKMNVLEIIELTKLAEKKFNLSIENIQKPIEKKEEVITEKKEEKTNFTIIMKNYGKSKINVIKIIRTILNLGLKEAKSFVESLPATIKENSNKEEAEKIKKQLEDVGATIELT